MITFLDEILWSFNNLSSFPAHFMMGLGLGLLGFLFKREWLGAIILSVLVGGLAVELTQMAIYGVEVLLIDSLYDLLYDIAGGFLAYLIIYFCRRVL